MKCHFRVLPPCIIFGYIWLIFVCFWIKSQSNQPDLDTITLRFLPQEAEGPYHIDPFSPLDRPGNNNESNITFIRYHRHKISLSSPLADQGRDTQAMAHTILDLNASLIPPSTTLSSHSGTHFQTTSQLPDNKIDQDLHPDQQLVSLTTHAFLNFAEIGGRETATALALKY
jgi:hypothetical protein